MWKDLEEDEFEEIHQVLSVFVSSIVLQRIHHAIMEVGGEEERKEGSKH